MTVIFTDISFLKKNNLTKEYLDIKEDFKNLINSDSRKMKRLKRNFTLFIFLLEKISLRFYNFI